MCGRPLGVPSILFTSQLSGVYYVDVPPGSGELVFRDPRGPLPPFEHSYAHVPKQGAMAVFPSWLVHEVLPTSSAVGTQHRVAISFNLLGQWESTSDVSVAFPA